MGVLLRPPGLHDVRQNGEEAERNAREAVAAHVALLRDTGRPVPEPTAHSAA